MSDSTVTRAKHFLVNRVLDQAKQDKVPLSWVEISMLGFSEASASPEEMEVAAAFEREVDDQRYEAKIAKLLRRAYEKAKENGNKDAWDQALDALGDEDIYLLVMVKRSGIGGWTALSTFLDWRLILGLAPACLCVSAGIVLAFTPIGPRLIRNDSVRLVLFVLLLAAPFLIVRIGSKKAG